MAVFGDTLRQARAYKGVTLREAEQATRINRHHLAALEDENFGVLPPLIYQRGIVRNYATYLELDPSKLLTMFDEARGSDGSPELVMAVKPLDMPNHWAPNFAVIAFMVVMGAIVFAWAYAALAPAQPTSTAPPAIATVTPMPNTPLSESASLGGPTATVAGSSRGAVDDSAAAIETDRASDPAPSATSKAEATETPRPTATAVPSATVPAPTPEPAPEPPPVVEPIVQAPIVEPTPLAAPTTGSWAISFAATAPIYLAVTVDGVVRFEGNLDPGGGTETYFGDQFQVYTSNVGATTYVANGSGPQIYNYSPGELSFTLP